MELKDFIIESMGRVREGTLNAVKDLTPVQLTWQAVPDANPIGFLLWHVARSEDAYFNRWIQPAGEVWETGGWYRRLNLPLRETGNSWNAEQVSRFPAIPLADLVGYMAAVQESSIEVLKGLDIKRLGEKPRPDRPTLTIANLLQNLTNHESHHQGSIEFMIGIMRSKGIR